MSEELKDIEETATEDIAEETAEPAGAEQQDEPAEKGGRPRRILTGAALVIIWLIIMLVIYHIYIKAVTQRLEKPAIYFHNGLAEGEEELITVTLELTEPGSAVTFAYPSPSREDGSSISWDVTLAGGTDMVLVDGLEYPYLFWEAEAGREYAIEEGWCVRGADTVRFLEDKLAELGLDGRESADFITYWAPRMQGSPYNLISFAGLSPEDGYGSAFTLSTDRDVPVRRVMMVWKRADRHEELPPQDIPAFVHGGTYIIEWGGTELE